MRVFNLTPRPLDYRGRILPPDGGSLEFPDLDNFIPERDRALARAGVISIGQLPKGWVSAAERVVRLVATQQVKPVRVMLKDEVGPTDQVNIKGKPGA